MRSGRRSRRGHTTVEFAFVAPLALLLILGLLISGLGVFRYQQMGHLAREASRWASVHGAQYAAETGNTAAAPADVYQQAIAPKVAGLDPNLLSYSVSWNTSNEPYHTTISDGQVTAVANTVTVTVSYRWIPEAYFGGMTLSGVSCSPMYY